MASANSLAVSRQRLILSRLQTLSGLWLVLSWLMGSPQAISADADNPLNLPTPRQPGQLGTVVLHGGGELSDEIFHKFIELAGGKQAQIVLIPSGTYVRGRIDGRDVQESPAAFADRMADRFASWVDLKNNGSVTDFRFLATDNQEDADDPTFVAALHEATGVWIPAAYQGKLDWRFAPKYPEQTSLFQKALREVVSRGGVVGGLGGGMAALSEVMIMGDSGRDDGPAKANLRYGLSIFNGAIVDQNFDVIGGRLERFTGLLKETSELNRRVTWPATGRSMIGLAVEQETALLLRGRHITAIGERRGHVFLKSNGDRTITWRILAPKDGTIDLIPSSAQADATAPAELGRQKSDTKYNPFGIPEPQAGSPPGTVVLHGGRDNLDLIQIYPQLAGARQPHFVHCPAADSDWRPASGTPTAALRRELAEYFHEWGTLVKEGQLASLQFLTTSDRADANREKFVSPLLKADAVWFSGGDQRELIGLFVDAQKPTLFQRELFNVVRRGGVVGGTSAGAAAMSEIMTVSGSPKDDGPVDAEIARGFGLLKNVIVEQHFQGAGRGGRIERFTRLLLDNDRLRNLVGADGTRPEQMLGVAVEEQTSLLLRGNHLRVFGKQNAHIFLKSADQKTVTWHELEPGDSAFLVEGRNGPVLELNDWRIRF